jgi:hypothetical protein
MATCGQCWADPDRPCVTSEAGPDGFHLARLIRAYRRGLLSAPALADVLKELVVFTNSTVVYDSPPNPRWWEAAVRGTCSHGGHEWDGETCDDGERCPRCGAISWGQTPDGRSECTRCLWSEPASGSGRGPGDDRNSA